MVRTILRWAALGLVVTGLVVFAANRGWIRLGDGTPFEIKAGYIQSTLARTTEQKKEFGVVFVHGIFGSRRESWLNQSNSFPALLADDPEFSGKVDVFVFEYFSPKFGSAASIVELAEQLRGSLEDHRVFENHQRVAFLGHSMGGLVTRKLLLTKRELISRVAFLYLAATPTNGSELAAIGQQISSNPQLRGLLPLEGNDLLQAIQADWVNWPLTVELPTYCAYELLPTNGIMVVTKGSATALCNRGFDPVSANHLDIAKPAGRADSRYTRFASALRRALRPTEQLGRRPASNALAPRPAHRDKSDVTGSASMDALPSAPPSVRVVRTDAQRVSDVKALYPPDAYRRGIHGWVIVEADVNETGDVGETRIVKSIPELDDAALEAIRQFRYKPPTVDGNARQFIAIISMAFSLSSPEPVVVVEQLKLNRSLTRIRTASPVYPRDAQERRISGVVVVQIDVGIDGKVSNPKILKSVPFLDQPAIEAVQQWEYLPVLMDGVPTKVTTSVTVNFTLQS